jgi:enoyl-CoA hydratase/carnithine racemase
VAEDFFAVRRDPDGVLEIRMHDGRGGPAVWSRGLLAAWGRVLREAASDPGTEVVVLTGTGDVWLAGAEREPVAVHDWPLAEVVAQWRAGVRLLEALVVEVEVPTIGVLNGPGFRQEVALMCDLTVCAESVVIGDGNFGAGSVPGDGMFLVLSQLLGPKRAAAAVYLGAKVPAAQAVELGLVNEVLPAAQVLARAHEMAASIAAGPAPARRLTHAVVSRGWQRRVVAELREQYALQMLSAR